MKKLNEKRKFYLIPGNRVDWLNFYLKFKFPCVLYVGPMYVTLLFQNSIFIICFLGREVDRWNKRIILHVAYVIFVFHVLIICLLVREVNGWKRGKICIYGFYWLMMLVFLSERELERWRDEQRKKIKILGEKTSSDSGRLFD